MKKFKELELILENQTIKYEMEFKKANSLFQENKKLRSSRDEINA